MGGIEQIGRQTEDCSHEDDNTNSQPGNQVHKYEGRQGCLRIPQPIDRLHSDQAQQVVDHTELIVENVAPDYRYGYKRNHAGQIERTLQALANALTPELRDPDRHRKCQYDGSENEHPRVR